MRPTYHARDTTFGVLGAKPMAIEVDCGSGFTILNNSAGGICYDHKGLVMSRLVVGGGPRARRPPPGGEGQERPGEPDKA
ncbi:MAG: hypothetical protein AB7W59_20280 [Acidimicrobiia bacterium]